MTEFLVFNCKHKSFAELLTRKQKKSGKMVLNKRITRSMVKEIKMVSSRVKTIINFSVENNVRITRSISKALNIIGLELPQPQSQPSPAKIHRRRHTSVKPTSTRRSKRIQSVLIQRPDPELWCICRRPDDGSTMILCDNDQCLIKWFHVECLKMVAIPGTEDSWYCANCSFLQKPKP